MTYRGVSIANAEQTSRYLFERKGRGTRRWHASIGIATENRRLLGAMCISAFFWAAIGILFAVISPFDTYFQTKSVHTELHVFLGDTISTPFSPTPPKKEVTTEKQAKPSQAPLVIPAPTIIPQTSNTTHESSESATDVSSTPIAEATAEPAQPVHADDVPPASSIGPPTENGAGASQEGGISASSLAILNEAIKRNLKYPPQARKRGIQGKVELEIAVNEAGSLTACELTAPSGSGLLDEAALKLLRSLFPLAETYGDPFRTRIAIEYRLN